MSVSADIIAGLVAAVLAIVWLVRLEGRVNSLASSKADAGAVSAAVAATDQRIAITDQKVSALEAAAKVHESTKEEVIRLQEQIKHLTSLVEGWMQAQAVGDKPRPRRPGTGV